MFERKIFSDVLQEMEMNLMPGFKLQWNYSVELQPDEYTETSETFFTNENVLKQYKIFFRYNIYMKESNMCLILSTLLPGLPT